MKLILDTNILIDKEDPKPVPPNLQELTRILLEHGHQIFVHPASKKDIENDGNLPRKQVMLSKIGGYPSIEAPPIPTPEFISNFPESMSSNDKIDNEILYSILKSAADFLITEDKWLQKKAIIVDLEDRVMSIDTAIDYFTKFHSRKKVKHTLLKEEFIRNLDIEDPFFDSLKDDYGKKDFTIWFTSTKTANRKCWVYREKEKINAVLLLKEEEEAISSKPMIPPGKRLKIAMLKVDLQGSKLGELFLRIAFQFCIDNHIPEVYLTHYLSENDKLIPFIEEFGFEFRSVIKRSHRPDDENVYFKKILSIPESNDIFRHPRKYYPSFRDKQAIKKFIVPIVPEYHDWLFPDYKKRQIQITEYTEINIPGNAIKKAYLCNSKIKRITPGDILLFYRSQDYQQITCVGVVDSIPLHTSKADEIVRTVGQRTVYTFDEIQEMTKKPTLVLLFKHHLNLPKPIDLETLKQAQILSSAPQSIVGLDHKRYERVKELGELDERFTIH